MFIKFLILLILFLQNPALSFCASSDSADEPLLTRWEKAELMRIHQDYSLELVTNEKYNQIYDNLSGPADAYELELVLGRRGAGEGELLLPTSVAILGGEIFVVDSGNRRILEFDISGEFRRAFVPEGASDPYRLFIQKGRIYLIDSKLSEIRIYDSQFKLLDHLGGKGVGKGELNSPNSLFVDNQNLLWVADDKNNRVEVYSLNKVFGRSERYLMNIDEYQPNLYLRAPKGISYAADQSEVFVIDSGTARILSFDEMGNYKNSVLDHSHLKGQVIMPQDLFVDAMSRMYIADHISHQILIYSSENGLLGAIGKTGQIPDSLKYIPDETSESKEEETIPIPLIKDQDFIDTDSELSFPVGITMEEAGDLWICDWGHNQVKKFSQSFYRKAMTCYKNRDFEGAIHYFQKCSARNDKYHLVEFYLAMCHYYLGSSEVVFEKKLARYQEAGRYLDILKLKSEIGRFQNDWITARVLYYLSQVNSYQDVR
jgi:sugar lactone lactonase YvrE